MSHRIKFKTIYIRHPKTELIQPLKCGSSRSSNQLLSKSSLLMTDWNSSIALLTSDDPQRSWITSLASWNLPAYTVKLMTKLGEHTNKKKFVILCILYETAILYIAIGGCLQQTAYQVLEQTQGHWQYTASPSTWQEYIIFYIRNCMAAPNLGIICTRVLLSNFQTHNLVWISRLLC